MLIDAEFFPYTWGGIALSYSHSIRPHRLDGSGYHPFKVERRVRVPLGVRKLQGLCL